MTRPEVTEFQREYELFQTELINLVDHRHGLVELAGSVDWEGAAERFGALYAANVGHSLNGASTYSAFAKTTLSGATGRSPQSALAGLG